MPKKDVRKKEIIKLIEKSESFVVIFNEKKGDQVSYSEFNILNGEMIIACEVVKAKILKNCSKGIK